MVRYRDDADGASLAMVRRQAGHSLIAARSPAMSITVWIVLGLGAGLLTNMLVPCR